jgi:hypothetical protein
MNRFSQIMVTLVYWNPMNRFSRIMVIPNKG